MRYAGVDEVGLGCLAGPIVSAVVVVDAPVTHLHLREYWPVRGVRDSKKTTPAQRTEILPRLVSFIADVGGSIGIGEASVGMINRGGYSAALAYTKETALRWVLDEGPIDVLVVDGSVPVTLADPRARFMAQHVAPKADADFWAVAAASIIAKSWRDAIMLRLDAEFPQYHWRENMGYAGGSKSGSPHVAALRKYGLSPHHRALPCQTILR